MHLIGAGLDTRNKLISGITVMLRKVMNMWRGNAFNVTKSDDSEEN